MTSYINLLKVRRCVAYRSAYWEMMKLLRVPRVSGEHIYKALSAGMKMGIYQGHDYAIGAHE
jgi:hypothetical protein